MVWNSAYTPLPDTGHEERLSQKHLGHSVQKSRLDSGQACLASGPATLPPRRTTAHPATNENHVHSSSPIFRYAILPTFWAGSNRKFGDFEPHSIDPSTLCQASKAPFDWSHADLEPIKQYLRSQAEAGVWQPRFSGGLWVSIKLWVAYGCFLRS